MPPCTCWGVNQCRPACRPPRRPGGDQDSGGTHSLQPRPPTIAVVGPPWTAPRIPRRRDVLTRTDFIKKKVYPKEGTRVHIPGLHCVCTQCEAVVVRRCFGCHTRVPSTATARGTVQGDASRAHI